MSHRNGSFRTSSGRALALAALAAAGSLALSNASYGYVLGNFETGNDGFASISAGASVTTGATGATLGTKALDLTNPQGSFWGIKSPSLASGANRAALQSAATYSADVTMTGAGLSGGN